MEESEIGLAADNGLMRLRIDCRGLFTSLVDLATGREVVPPGEVGNLLQVHRDTRLGIHGNARAVQVLNRIYHLMGSPRILLHPALVGAAIRAKVVGYGPATPRPPALDALAPG